MLNLSLTAVERGEVRVRETVSVEDAVWQDTALTPLTPLDVDATAKYVGEGVYVRGRLRGRFRTSCRRCLTATEHVLDEPVDMLFQEISPDDEGAEGEVYPLPESGSQLDIAPAIREELVLRVPQYALCRESCRGLCPRCGADLNDGECGCVPETDSSPWDALKKLKLD